MELTTQLRGKALAVADQLPRRVTVATAHFFVERLLGDDSVVGSSQDQFVEPLCLVDEIANHDCCALDFNLYKKGLKIVTKIV